MTTKTLKCKVGTGWKNLFSHIEKTHADYKEMMQANSPFVFRVPAKATNIYRWIKLIISQNLPFSHVNDLFVRECSSLDTISSTTLEKHVILVSNELESKLQAILPPKVGIIFDGWACGRDHYLAIFACVNDDSSHKIYLLAFQPIPDYEAEISNNAYRLDASAHKDLIESTLLLYKRDIEDILFLVGDNCSTNKLLARLCQVPFVGCASHRLNLAVQKFLKVQDLVLLKIQNLMTKLSSYKQSAKLRRFTPLQPVQRNYTRWSSCYEMLRRYLQISAIMNSGFDELLEYIPTVEEST